MDECIDGWIFEWMNCIKFHSPPSFLPRYSTFYFALGSSDSLRYIMLALLALLALF